MWVETIKRQLDLPESQRPRALALDDDELSRLLPGTSLSLASAYRREALTQAATVYLAIHGPAARLEDGRAAAELFIAAEKNEMAADALAAAVDAGCNEGHTRSCLATVLWTLGRHREVLSAQRDALLYDPAGVRESEIQIPPLLDLLDDLADLDDLDDLDDGAGGADLLPWLPIFADLRGLVRLPREASPVSPAAPLPRQVAALLVDLRLESKPERRIQLKRRIGQHAAWLKAPLRAR